MVTLSINGGIGYHVGFLLFGFVDRIRGWVDSGNENGFWLIFHKATDGLSYSIYEISDRYIADPQKGTWSEGNRSSVKYETSSINLQDQDVLNSYE